MGGRARHRQIRGLEGTGTILGSSLLHVSTVLPSMEEDSSGFSLWDRERGLGGLCSGAHHRGDWLSPCPVIGWPSFFFELIQWRLWHLPHGYVGRDGVCFVHCCSLRAGTSEGLSKQCWSGEMGGEKDDSIVPQMGSACGGGSKGLLLDQL